MTIPLWGILFLILITFSLAALGDYLRFRELGDFDNNYPRDQTAKLTGIGARVWAAQQNSWEALIMYVPSVLVAHIVGADPALSGYAALVFCAARVVHAGCYLANIATIRSASYFVALGCCVWLFWLSGSTA